MFLCTKHASAAATLPSARMKARRRHHPAAPARPRSESLRSCIASAPRRRSTTAIGLRGARPMPRGYAACRPPARRPRRRRADDRMVHHALSGEVERMLRAPTSTLEAHRAGTALRGDSVGIPYRVPRSATVRRERAPMASQLLLVVHSSRGPTLEPVRRNCSFAEKQRCRPALLLLVCGERRWRPRGDVSLANVAAPFVCLNATAERGRSCHRRDGRRWSGARTRGLSAGSVRGGVCRRFRSR